MINKIIKIIYSGLIAGFVSEGFLGAIFMSAPIKKIIYNPDWQSKLFLEVTPTRDLFQSVAGVIILSVSHSWLFSIFQKSIPGNTWINKGLFWGLTIWLMYWVFQEWFIYHTLLQEPILLNLVELAILLAGSLLEGTIISRLVNTYAEAQDKAKISHRISK
jgi:hypothetical protein